jgi:protein ImuB
VAVSREGGPRVVALRIPDLPLQRVLRGRAAVEPAGTADAAARPVAVAAEGRILCADRAARAEGVRPGATVAEAVAACGRLVVVPADPSADAAALRALAEALLGVAPAVELAAADALLLDASAAHLLARPDAQEEPDEAAPERAGGSGGREGLSTAKARVRAPGQPDEAAPERAGGSGGREGLSTAKARVSPRSDEERLARRAIAVAEEMGYVARAAVATGRGPACALALHAPGPVAWVPPDGAARALAAFPVAALGLGPEVAARLAALGVDSAGALARLPEGTLAHRFGPAGVLAARLARGEDDSPLVPYVPRTLPEEGVELEAPADSAEPLLFALKRLADRVAARLAGRGLGASRLRLVLKLDPRGEERLDVPLAAATAAPSRWLLPLKEHLFSIRLPAAVVALRLVVVEVAVVAPEQLAIGDRPEALAALEGVLARLAVRLGDGAMFAAEPVDRYRPEGAYRAVPFRTGPRRRRSGAAKPAQSSLAGVPASDREAPPAAAACPAASSAAEEGARPTRLLAVPAPVVAEGEGGRLTALRVDGRARAVLAMEGPERLRSEWWSGPFDRDYYRVRLEGLGDCWVYRDGGDGRLWLHGFFD